jgi:hypothetical protein
MRPDRGASRRLASFLRRDRADRLLLIEAAVRLIALRLCLKVIGPGRQPRLYGRAGTPALGEKANRAIGLSPAQRRTAARIGWAIARAERALPFDVVCLPQALVARRMLRRRGIASVMFFGVELDKPIAQVGTHAWLLAGEVPVTGVGQASRYKAFASYVSGTAK